MVGAILVSPLLLDHHKETPHLLLTVFFIPTIPPTATKLSANRMKWQLTSPVESGGRFRNQHLHTSHQSTKITCMRLYPLV
ncbi:hypothetical protein GDO81_016436 [Engystomops pustulosus]|uniref:Secreted protein n=1 Tax=Engystomops pustulosus TaxID=76066 RepID=A0AAV7AY96_ENGPU|nr:hypothetical protein GDO81_016436 [Engystomops pustulosus]